jgi:glycosyl transferase, family 25
MTDRMAIRVISMTASHDRRAMMQCQLEKLASQDWAFFDACETLPSSLAYDGKNAYRILRRDMSKGEQGCFASHLSIWQWFVEQDTYSSVVILEDDVVLDLTFFETLPTFMQSLPGIGYLRLYAKSPTPVKLLGFISGKHIMRHKAMAYGTQGYVLRKSAAQAFLSSITTISRPVDDEMDRYWIHKVPSVGVFPYPIMEISFPSTIGNSRRAGLSQKRSDYIRWKIERWSNNVQRRIANLKYSLSEIRLD